MPTLRKLGMLVRISPESCQSKSLILELPNLLLGMSISYSELKCEITMSWEEDIARFSG